MKIFEIHITGSPNINEILDSFNLKNIIVDLLKPNGEVLRTEHMSSFVEKHVDYETCLNRVKYLVDELKRNGVEIYRVKIESPYDDDHAWFSQYIESHFVKKDGKFPVSVNKMSGKIIETDRAYNRYHYNRFREVWKDEDVELCLYDTEINHDKDWLNMYGRKW